MNIENIVEKRLRERAITVFEKAIPSKPVIMITDKLTFGEMHYCDIRDLASQISSDIKKELKLVASGKPKLNDDYGLDWIEIPHDIAELIVNKEYNIYIEEIKW